jgi:uncharacterized protein YdhG (YjbR/CyaY superfamily)
MLRKRLASRLLMFLVIFLLAGAFPAKAESQNPEKTMNYLKQLESKLEAAKKEKNLKRVKLIEKMILEQKAVLESSLKKAQPTVSSKVEGIDELKDELSEYKEENNKALAELKSQIDKAKKDVGAKVGGVVFFRWQKPMQNAGSMVNNFDVDRAYIDLKKKLDKSASARVTLDVARITGAARQNLFDYLKYAYFEAPVELPAVLKPFPWELTAKIGLQHTVWIDWADKQLDLRFVAKSLLDNEGVMSSADFGLGALGKIMLSFLPEIEYHATLLNGSGYATSEGNGKKSLALRLNSKVFDGEDAGKVIVGAFLNIDSLNLSSPSLSGNGVEKQAGLAVSYQHEKGRAFLEYLAGTKSSKKVSGISLGGVLGLGSLWDLLSDYSLFARFDNYDPDTSAANDLRTKSFYGLVYDWGKDIKLAFDVQNAQTGSGSVASIFYLHTMVSL